MVNRPIIVAVVQLILGLLTAAGVVLPEGIEALLVDNAVAIAGGALALAGVIRLVRERIAARQAEDVEDSK